MVNMMNTRNLRDLRARSHEQSFPFSIFLLISSCIRVEQNKELGGYSGKIILILSNLKTKIRLLDIITKCFDKILKVQTLILI